MILGILGITESDKKPSVRLGTLMVLSDGAGPRPVRADGILVAVTAVFVFPSCDASEMLGEEAFAGLARLAEDANIGTIVNTGLSVPSVILDAFGEAFLSLSVIRTFPRFGPAKTRSVCGACGGDLRSSADNGATETPESSMGLSVAIVISRGDGLSLSGLPAAALAIELSGCLIELAEEAFTDKLSLFRFGLRSGISVGAS